MNILINFSAQKKGGGQNVAINFIQSIKSVNIEDDLLVIVSKGSKIDESINTLNIKTIKFSPNPIIRILQELILLPQIIKKHSIEIVYSYFGYTLLKRKYIQVCGVAVSNLFYPEVVFWSEYTGISLLKRRLIDRYRLFGMKRAHGLVFENENMMRRSHDLYHIEQNRTKLIKPSIQLEVANNINYDKTNKKHKLNRILLLCGWQLNKNIMEVPKIASYLKRHNIEYEFIITAPQDKSKSHKEFNSLVKKYDVDKYIKLIGVVEKENLGALYKSIDYVLLMSKLESFSNNIIEAWAYKKPLLITDADWAKSICKDGAIYVNRNCANEIADTIYACIINSKSVNKIIENGVNQLLSYPSIQQKTIEEINYLKIIYELENTI